MEANTGTIFKETNGNTEIAKSLGDRLETVIFLLEALDDFIRRSPFIFESLNEEITKYREKLSGNGTASEVIAKLVNLLGEEDVLRLMDAVSKSYNEVKENDYKTSLPGILRALSDEDIQRAIAFILLTLKKIGAGMKSM